MTDPLHSQNLVPFKKRRGPYHIPGMTGEGEERALEVDRNLDPEEARFIRHYLGYADTLLKNTVDEELEPKEEKISAQDKSSAEAAGPDQSKDLTIKDLPIEDEPAIDRSAVNQPANDRSQHENPTAKAA